MSSKSVYYVIKSSSHFGTSDKTYQLLAHGRWFSLCTLASSTTKTGRHDIVDILLKVALNTKNQIKSIIHVLCIINHYLFIYNSLSHQGPQNMNE
jgi:hypothetical protein